MSRHNFVVKVRVEDRDIGLRCSRCGRLVFLKDGAIALDRVEEGCMLIRLIDEFEVVEDDAENAVQ